jgi:hypothetical protein
MVVLATDLISAYLPVGPQGIQGRQGLQGPPLTWSVKTANYTAVNGDAIVANTAGGSFNITLPATPVAGTMIAIADGNNWSTNNLTVLRNGSTIEGVADNLILDVRDVRIDLVYNGTTWQVYANIGPPGAQGTTGAGTQGAQGVQGLTGAGTQGSQGITGAGTQGAQGIQGLTGAGTQGSQGITGAGTQGAQGIQGLTGSQGTQGLQGITGSQGTQGIQGRQGVQGIQGLQGIQSLQGLQGITGSQGTSGGGGGSVTIADDTTTNATRYIGFVSATSGTATTLNVSSTKLYFNPSTGTLNATLFNSLSDETLKTDLTKIDGAVSLINKIQGFRFKWKEGGEDSMGVSAQEVEQVFPELVSNDEYKSVNYNGIIAVLIEAIKELSKEIKSK